MNFVYIYLRIVETRGEKNIAIHTWNITNGRVRNVKSSRKPPSLGIICVPSKVNVCAGQLTTIHPTVNDRPQTLCIILYQGSYVIKKEKKTYRNEF